MQHVRNYLLIPWGNQSSTPAYRVLPIFFFSSLVFLSQTDRSPAARFSERKSGDVAADATAARKRESGKRHIFFTTIVSGFDSHKNYFGQCH